MRHLFPVSRRTATSRLGRALIVVWLMAGLALAPVEAAGAPSDQLQHPGLDRIAQAVPADWRGTRPAPVPPDTGPDPACALPGVVAAGPVPGAHQVRHTGPTPALAPVAGPPFLRPAPRAPPIPV